MNVNIEYPTEYRGNTIYDEKRVSELQPKDRPELSLVTGSIEVNDILDSCGIKHDPESVVLDDSYNSLLVNVENGEYSEVWGIHQSVPHLSHYAVKLVWYSLLNFSDQRIIFKGPWRYPKPQITNPFFRSTLLQVCSVTMTNRITQSDLESLVSDLNEQYDIELILSVYSPDSRTNTYRLREKEPDSGERDIGPAGNSRELWHFLQGIKYANNGWIES